MELEKYNLNQAMTKLAEDDIPYDGDELANIVDILRLYRRDNPHELNKQSKEMIDNLPSKYMVRKEMNRYELKMLYKTLGHLWKQVTGERLSDMERPVRPNQEAQHLDGCYWLLPGEILVSGFNHYDAAKKHKGAICRLLNINPIIFEKALASEPHRVIETVLKNHGVRVVVDRDNSSVFMQCSERSWPTARNKLRKMYHKKKVLRVLDKSKPFESWDSGVPLLIK